MTVNLIGKSVVELQGDQERAVVAMAGGELGEKQDVELQVSPVVQVGTLYGPGEYEYGGIGVVAVETKPVADGVAEVVVLRIEEISTMFITNQPDELKKEHWETLGEVDILCIDAQMEIKDLDKLINRVNPYVLLLLNSDAAAAEKLTSLQVEATAKKHKFLAKEFEGEDPVTRLFLLA